VRGWPPVDSLKAINLSLETVRGPFLHSDDPFTRPISHERLNEYTLHAAATVTFEAIRNARFLAAHDG
jgi:hypothetical protein